MAVGLGNAFSFSSFSEDDQKSSQCGRDSEAHSLILTKVISTVLISGTK